MGLLEVIATKGLFSSLEPRWQQPLFPDPKVGGRVVRVHLTQVGRALAELKVEYIRSHSPRAHGRMEQVLGPSSSFPLLRLYGIATMAAASWYLRGVYITEHNRYFPVSADEEGVPSCCSSPGCTISCAFATSAWSATTTVSATRGGCCRSPSSAIGSTLALFCVPRRLAGYHPDGTLIENDAASPSVA